MRDFSTLANTTGSFPDVVAEDCSGVGATDGTPYVAQIIDDGWFGWMQALLNDQGMSPSGSAEADGSSDILDALKSLISRLAVDPCVSNWTQQSPAAANSLAKGATDGNISCFVEFGGAIQYTYDGVNYTRVVLGGALRDIAYGNGYWVAVGASGALYYAADPTGAWTSNTQGATDFNSVYYGNGYWCAVGASGTVRYATDPTGSWTSNTQGSSEFKHVCYANGYWVAVGASGTLYYKTTNPTSSWTSNTQGANTLNSVAYGEIRGTGYWIAVGDSNTIYTKTTTPVGSWTSRTSAAQSGAVLRDVDFGSECFCVVGDTDLDTQTRGIQVSFNGTTFVNKPSVAEQLYIYGCLFAANQFIVVGTSGEIQTSLHTGDLL